MVDNPLIFITISSYNSACALKKKITTNRMYKSRRFVFTRIKILGKSYLVYLDKVILEQRVVSDLIYRLNFLIRIGFNRSLTLLDKEMILSLDEIIATAEDNGNGSCVDIDLEYKDITNKKLSSIKS